MVTCLESDILEYEVKWTLESISINKASGGDIIPAELFQILKDEAVKVLHSICQQIDCKRLIFILVPKKGNTQECSNSTWMEDFQKHKLDLEKAKEPEIKLPAFAGS